MPILELTACKNEVMLIILPKKTQVMELKKLNNVNNNVLPENKLYRRSYPLQWSG